jgi:hypothetical protein
MIHSIKQELTLSVPITLAGHHKAQMFYQRHHDPHKAKQIYLNTLAVEAVHIYLSWLGIASDPQASDSWNPVMQMLADTADLEIMGQGKLECRPVLPEATSCYIPPETNADRIGYLPVRLDAALQTATLLGFIPGADVGIETEEVPLTRLQPVTSLLDYLKPPSVLTDKRTFLRQWLEGAVTSGWQSVEALLDPQPVFSFRSSELSDPGDITGAAIRCKLLEFVPPATPPQNRLRTRKLQSLQSVEKPSLSAHTGCRVALIVSIAPTDALQSNIWIRLCPVGGDRYLPEKLEIRILDDQETVVMEAQSRQTDMIQLHFRGMLSEQFAVEVALNGVSLVEKFVI